VRAALAPVAQAGGDALPGVAQAEHVALALLAHFYESPEANDLCHERAIGRSLCRPLAAQADAPAPLRRAARRS
jgi:hypothetical protein